MPRTKKKKEAKKEQPVNGFEFNEVIIDGVSYFFIDQDKYDLISKNNRHLVFVKSEFPPVGLAIPFPSIFGGNCDCEACRENA